MKTNIQLQKGSIALWAIIAAVAVIGIGGYVYYSTAQRSSVPVPAPIAANVPVEQSSAPVSSATSPVTQPVMPSTAATLDCSKYISASELISTLGLSSQTQVKFGSTTNKSCHLSWIDSSQKIGDAPISTGGLTISTGNSTSMNASISALCLKKKPFTVGDVSCYSEASGTPNGGIAFLKSDVMVWVIPISAQTITADEITALAKLIESRL